MNKQKELSSTLTSFQHKFNLKLVVYLLFGFIFGVVIERSSQKINKPTSKLKTNRDSEKPSIQTPSSQFKNGTGCFAEITEYHLTLFVPKTWFFCPKYEILRNHPVQEAPYNQLQSFFQLCTSLHQPTKDSFKRQN